jgi:hypothetical protein
LTSLWKKEKRQPNGCLFLIIYNLSKQYNQNKTNKTRQTKQDKQNKTIKTNRLPT